MGLMTTGEDNTTELIATKNKSTINIPSIKNYKVIKEIDVDSNEFNEIDIVHVNSIIVSKSVKSKNLILLKEFRADFLTLETRLVFIQLR